MFAELDEVVEGDTVLSSSSSAMPCSQYTEKLKHRAQCLVSHPVSTLTMEIVPVLVYYNIELCYEMVNPPWVKSLSVY